MSNTIWANSKVVVHWCKEFSYETNAGMAYVSLGRSEQIKDIYIKGKVQKEGIHAHQQLWRKPDDYKLFLMKGRMTSGKSHILMSVH